MYLMYADESGNTGTDYDNKEQPIFVLAGVLVEDIKWHDINNFFNHRKIKILPILKDNEIHTNELFNSSKKSVFNQFKWQDNFKTLENFEQYIQNNLYTSANVEFSNYQNSGELHMFDATFTDKNNENSNAITKTFIVKLLEGTDFVMSFNV